MANPRVFISYSWDSDAHRAWALMLADMLVEKGVDVQFDQYGIKLGRNIKRKMEQNVENVDKVILILTENYKAKADGREGGIGFEYTMISNEWYEEQSENDKFIPVLRSGTKKTSIPLFIRGYLYADMREGADFEKALEDVLRAIYDEPRNPRPELGERPVFEQRDRPTTPHLDTSLDSNFDNIGDDINRSNHVHETKKKLKEFIQDNDLEGALNGLKDFAEESGNPKLGNEVILLFSRFNSLNSETLKGLLAADVANIRKNQIQHAVMSTIEGLK